MYVCPQCASISPSAAPCLVDGATPTSSDDDPMIGSMVKSYRVAAKIGVGGMGAVYRAVHPQLGSWVAIKILSHESTADLDVVSRFFDEARSVNLVRHESIVNILDLAQLPDGRPYLVMEYLEGASLKVLVRRGPVPPAEACRIAIDVLDALAAAHERGVLHRDVKPDNIVLSPHGWVTLIDFGVARAPVRITPRTAQGTILGTPEYMSPEQARGGELGAGTDLYALGIVLYEMLTGRRPFDGGSLFETLRQHVEEPPPPPSTWVPMPAELEQIVLMAIAKDPRQRYPSARAMQEALRECGVRSTARASMPNQVPRAPTDRLTTITVDHRSGNDPMRSWSAGPLAQASSPSMAVAPGEPRARSQLRGRVALIAGGSVLLVVALIASRAHAPRSSSSTASVESVTSGPASEGKGLNPCVAFEEIVRRLESCEVIPRASRDAMKNGAAMMRQVWASPSTASETREAIWSACRDAMAGLTITLSACSK